MAKMADSRSAVEGSNPSSSAKFKIMRDINLNLYYEPKNEYYCPIKIIGIFNQIVFYFSHIHHNYELNAKNIDEFLNLYQESEVNYDFEFEDLNITNLSI